MIIPTHGHDLSGTTTTTTTEPAPTPLKFIPSYHRHLALATEDGSSSSTDPPPKSDSNITAMAVGIFGGMVAMALLCCLCAFRRQLFYRQRGWTLEKWEKFKSQATNDSLERSPQSPDHPSALPTHSTLYGDREEEEEDESDEDDKASRLSRPGSRASRSVKSMSVGPSDRRRSMTPYTRDSVDLSRPLSRIHIPGATTMSISSKTSKAASANWYKVIELPSPPDEAHASGTMSALGTASGTSLQARRVMYQPVNDPFCKEGELYHAREPSIATTTLIAVEAVDEDEEGDEESREDGLNRMTENKQNIYNETEDEDDAKTTRSSIRSAFERPARMYKDRQERKRKSHISEYFSDHESARIRSRSRERGKERPQSYGGGELRSWVDSNVSDPELLDLISPPSKHPTLTTIGVDPIGQRIVMPVTIKPKTVVTTTVVERNDQGASPSGPSKSMRLAPTPMVTTAASGGQSTASRLQPGSESSSISKKPVTDLSTSDPITSTPRRTTFPATATNSHVDKEKGTSQLTGGVGSSTLSATVKVKAASGSVKPSNASTHSKSSRSIKARSNLCVPSSASNISLKATCPVSTAMASTAVSATTASVSKGTSGQPLAARPVSTQMDRSQMNTKSIASFSPAILKNTTEATTIQNGRGRGNVALEGGGRVVAPISATPKSKPKSKPKAGMKGTKKSTTMARSTTMAQASTGSKREMTVGTKRATVVDDAGQAGTTTTTTTTTGAVIRPRLSISWPTAIYSKPGHHFNSRPNPGHKPSTKGAKRL